MKFSLKNMTAVSAAGLFLLASNALFAQEVAVGSGSGQAGGNVTIDWGYTEGSDAAGIEWCLEWDTSVVTMSDDSDCVANAPAGFDGSFTSCSTGTATCPNGLNVAVAANDFDTVIPTTSPFGSVVFAIDGTATAGDTAALTATCIDVSSGTSDPTVLDCSDMTTLNGEIEVVDLTAVLNTQPTSHNFGGVEAGTSSSPLEVTISNDGSDGVDMDVSGVSLTDTTNFSLDMNGGSNPCGPTTFTLSDGQSCTVDVTFTPASEAVFTASLDVTSDAGQVTNDSVSLEGEGTPGPAGALTISPNPHSFGEHLTNDESSTQTFTATSDGDSGSEVDVDTVNLTGDTSEFTVVADNCTGQNLPQGSSCTVDVEFAPTMDGAWSAQLEISGTDGNGDTRGDTADMSGEGVSEPRFSSDPDAGLVSLGMTPPGGTLDQDVTITNDGNADLTVDCGALNDPDDVFTMTPDGFSWILAGGESDSFNVSCTVPDVQTYEATLSCNTNDADNDPVDYTFRCTGRPLVIPTMQPWGLILLSLMMLAIGGFSIRFFRAG